MMCSLIQKDFCLPRPWIKAYVFFLLHLVSGTIKELKSEAVPFVSQLVRHLTIVGVVQQAGPCPIKPQAR